MRNPFLVEKYDNHYDEIHYLRANEFVIDLQQLTNHEFLTAERLVQVIKTFQEKKPAMN